MAEYWDLYDEKRNFIGRTIKGVKQRTVEND